MRAVSFREGKDLVFYNQDFHGNSYPHLEEVEVVAGPHRVKGNGINIPGYLDVRLEVRING